MTTSLTEAEVLRACKILFGTEIPVSRDFLFYLQPEGLKTAYRKKVKETHPDFFVCESPNIQKERASLFRDVVDAYDVVSRYFEQREKGMRFFSAPRDARSSRDRKKHDWAPNGSVYGCRHIAPVVRNPLPLRPMQIGQYLYHQGFITYCSLIDAIVWQRHQRPIMGEIALHWRWLDNAAIERITWARGLRGRFGEKALGLDLLTSFQVKVLLNFQRTLQERLGTYFVRNKIMTSEKLERLVRQLYEHNARFQDEPLHAKQTRHAFT